MGRPEPDQYEGFADEFEAHAASAPYNALYDRPAVLRLLDERGDLAGRRVLDAACGPGFYLAELLARGADVVGCDASPRMVELARERVGGAGSGVELHVHSLDDPLEWLGDGSVDVVLCALAYHYLNDRPAFLAECRRVLRPDGSLVISTTHPTSDWRRLGGSYFEVAPFTEVWHTGWTVTAWRAPLGHLTEEFAVAGFLIERLVEPRPDPAMATAHPKAYADLTHEPGFILFALRPT